MSEEIIVTLTREGWCRWRWTVKRGLRIVSGAELTERAARRAIENERQRIIHAEARAALAEARAVSGR